MIENTHSFLLLPSFFVAHAFIQMNYIKTNLPYYVHFVFWTIVNQLLITFK